MEWRKCRATDVFVSPAVSRAATAATPKRQQKNLVCSRNTDQLLAGAGRSGGEMVCLTTSWPPSDS